MSVKGFIVYHKLSIAICIFLICFGAVHFLKPSILYNKDGSFRQFGVGYRHKTVIPIWLVAIIVAILSYLAVLFAIREF